MSVEALDEELHWDGGHMGENSGVDLRGPIAEHHNIIAERHIGREDIQVKIEDEWAPLGDQRFEPHDTLGMLERYVYDHKTGLKYAAGVVAVGAVITALAAVRYVSKHKNK
jgi:hypothetical protein